MEKYVMAIEHIILNISGAIFLLMTACEFLLHKSITLVRLFKHLLAEIRSP